MTIVVTIDGPSGSGKSTIARLLAKRKKFRYLDSGAIYRAVAYILDSKGLVPEESENLVDLLEDLSVQPGEERISVNGTDVTDKIRLPEVSALASAFSALPAVRNKLLDIQREQAVGQNLVAEGRDMGSVVFPDAELKIFLTAASEERARRRYVELSEKGYKCSFEDILQQITERDRNDSKRKVSPLVKPEDAIEIDTTGLAIEEVLRRIMDLVSDISPGETYRT
jgi:cytidylate kinase